MRIKKFIEFIPEAYLLGGRQPIYHFTSISNMYKIVESDILKTSKPSRQSHGHNKSISLTRNIDYSDSISGCCIELDSDILYKNGYKSYPVDEWAWKDGKVNKSAIKNFNFIKSNFPEVKSGRRGTRHGLDLTKDPILETEFEERIYKDIKDLGKYIISIYVSKSDVDKLKGSQNMKDYLEKYPHIKVYTHGKWLRDDKIDITDDIKIYKKVKV